MSRIVLFRKEVCEVSLRLDELMANARPTRKAIIMRY
jgi:hypothetical protein